jgi:hypothetical protein
VSELSRIKELAAEDEYIHDDILEDITGHRPWAVPNPPAEPPPTCVYCNAPWTPEMVELVVLSGYCSTCADAERVIDIFCSSCERLVYRKEVRS